MKPAYKLRGFFLLLLDIGVLYLILYFVILLRFQKNFTPFVWKQHLLAFTPVFFIWIINFYIGRLYENRQFSNTLKFLSAFGKIQLINLFWGIVFFYLFPHILTPKTNLLLVWIIASFIIFLTHLWYNKLASNKVATNIVIIGENSNEVQELINYLKNNPSLGYKMVKLIDNDALFSQGDFQNYLKSNDIKIIVVCKVLGNTQIQKAIYNALSSDVIIEDFVDFYEDIFQKTPLSLVEDPEFLAHLDQKSLQLWSPLKRIMDVILSILIISFTSVIWPFIIGFILLVSPGPIFYIGERRGKNNKSFKLIKFRTMIPNANNLGPSWTLENDQRIIKGGQFLRKFYLDELPEFLNVLWGDLSIVGPRPEEINLVKLFEKEIPFYNIRHIVKPGITGWAQINYPNTASIEGAKQKLQYDLYYLRHYSIWLDLVIILKTLHVPLDIPAER